MGKGLQRGVDVCGKGQYFAALLVGVMRFSRTLPHRQQGCSERLITMQLTWASAATGAHNCPLKTEPEMSQTDPQFVTSETGSPALCYRVMTHGEGKRDFVCVPCQMQSLGYESPNCPRAKHSSGTPSLCRNDFSLQCVTAGAVWSSKVCRVFTRKTSVHTGKDKNWMCPSLWGGPEMWGGGSRLPTDTPTTPAFKKNSSNQLWFW